jgi:crotonobetainyl-CoA:carnitine CoA-transferase CaiB-like acyl-CoA transferase
MSDAARARRLQGARFTQVLAGATCTRLLAEMGAEVIKIELPPKGDFSRDFGAFRDGRSAYYIQQNRGRKSVCVDPNRPAGLEILRALVPKVDVLVENFAPGVIGRMGLGWEEVSRQNPKIVMRSISASTSDLRVSVGECFSQWLDR